jgi:hypothetical protein
VLVKYETSHEYEPHAIAAPAETMVTSVPDWLRTAPDEEIVNVIVENIPEERWNRLVADVAKIRADPKH